MISSLNTINYMTVLLAALAKFFLGALWYSPLIAGCAWLKEMKLEERDIDQKKDNIPYKLLGSFVCAYITAVVMTILIKVMGVNDLVSGLNFGLLIAVGFVLTAILNIYYFEDRSLKLYLITAGHHCLTYSVMGAILGAWS